MRDAQIATFYDPRQTHRDVAESFSKSPSKPDLLLRLLDELGASSAINTLQFPAFDRSDFLLAHSPDYVDAFFAGRQPLCSSNSIPWSRGLAESIRFTNASLFHAQLHALQHPNQISFSPTSGFHHAKPEKGSGFCTFSGQVISALKLYREFGVSGLWIDLDAHFGNSIEDSRKFCPDLNDAIPRGCNINPDGQHREYLTNLVARLAARENDFIEGKLHWIAFAQGADSHQSDDLRGQLFASEWLEASEIVYKWIAKLETKLNRSIPLTISLFGGYRSDDYDTVLHLHAANILTALRELVDARWGFDATVKEIDD